MDANGTAAAPSVAELSSIFSQTEGPILVASFISCLLYGLLLHQAYRYLRLCSSDLLFIRVLVPIVILLETIYTVCSIHYCYHTFVSNYASPNAFLHNVWSGNLLPIVGITAASVTHIFFIRRVWMIGGPYRLLSVLAGVFHIAGTGFGTAVTVRGFILNSPAAFTTKIWIIGTCFALNVSADISISGALLCVIYQGRSYRNRNMSIADKVAAYLVNTGILVLVLDMATLILAVSPHSNVNYGAIQLINARMYAITLFSVSLNPFYREGTNIARADMVALPRDSTEALGSLLGDPSSFLSKTNGAMLLGSFVGTVLYGVLLHQAYRYMRLYPTDGAFMKTLVPIIVVLESFRTVCDIHYSYHDLVTKYAQILDIVLYLPCCCLFVLIGIATHIFFILRIWKLKSRLRFLAVFATAFHVVELVLGIVMSVRGFQLGGPAYFSKKWLIALCFGAGTLADLSITGALLAVMYNGRATHERPASIWDNVTVYFTNTGLLVLILDLVVFILVLSTANNLYWSAVHAVTTKIYATTLMSVYVYSSYFPHPVKRTHDPARQAQLSYPGK
ncbi:hypothetical protein C8T65DRAFT_739344 [Cerioporus squamosus]|nr:hypothetical protein C8T65DRAFT_739344 [Cerioporus squamosus]